MGAIIIVIIVFTLLFIALRYVRMATIVNINKDDPLLEKQQARLSGCFV